MPIVQHSQPVEVPEARWWTAVHPHAVQLERLLTPDPGGVPEREWGAIVNTLRGMEEALKGVPHTRATADVHATLERAVNYLRRCYEELLRQCQHNEEGRFYYNSALVQVTKLHQFLIEHGLIT